MVFAADWAEADGYRVLLETANIPALIKASGDDAMLDLTAGGAVPVLVPEQLHDEASEIIAGVEASTPTDFDEAGDLDGEDEDDDPDHDDLDGDDDLLNDNDGDLI